MSFDTGDKVGQTVVTQAPDFSASISKYNERVALLGQQIKDEQAKLQEVQEQIAQAEVDAQQGADQRRTELNAQMATIQAQIESLTQSEKDWALKVQQRQEQHESIVLDFSNRERALTADMSQYQNGINALTDDQAKLAADQKSLINAQAQLATDRSTFETYTESVTAQAIARKHDMDAQQTSLDDQAHDIAVTAARVKAEQDQLSLDQEALKVKAELAVSIIAQSDAVAAQKRANDAQLAINSAAALKNDQDANQIRTAQVALNNLQQELNARQQMIALAEQKQ